MKKFLALLIMLSITSVKAQYSNIKVTEIMYNAKASGVLAGESLEFIELKNTGSTAINLSGISFTSGITYSFPSSTAINGGAFVVLVTDSVSFKQKYPGVDFFDQYADTLSNKGELIQLAIGIDTFINFTYNDNLPWPVLADGNGFSIVPVIANPTGNQNKANEWRASAFQGGSPGADDPTPISFPEVLITECLTHTDPPQYDAVELYNNTLSAVDVSGWYLTDDRNKSRQFQLPANAVIQPGNYLTFYESDFNTGLNAFTFNRIGEQVLLFSADTAGELNGYAHGWEFEAQYNGVSFGLYTTSIGENHFVSQSNNTLNGGNAYPKVGPVVITKIMYDPTSLEDEYLVLKNITDSTVNLYYEAWDGVIPDTTWKVKGISFQFPPNVSLVAGEEIVLTGIDPANFRIKYNLPSATKVYQFTGKLKNSGERIALYAPERRDTSSTGVIFTPYVLIDAVEFDNNSPWPVSAAGLGDRLERVVHEDYGNDVVNWTAATGNVVSAIGEAITQRNEMTIFPNPMDKKTTIVFGGKNQSGDYQIRNVTGKVVDSDKFNGGQFEINRNNFPSGVYFIEINSENIKVCDKLVVK